MKEKTLGRLFADAVKAYDQECVTSGKWQKEAIFWHERALQAEFINEVTPWFFMGAMIAVVLVAILIRV